MRTSVQIWLAHKSEDSPKRAHRAAEHAARMEGRVFSILHLNHPNYQGWKG